MRDLEKRLNYSFHNPALLEEALNHSSYANELEKEGTPYQELLFHYFQNVEIMKIWE